MVESVHVEGIVLDGGASSLVRIVTRKMVAAMGLTRSVAHLYRLRVWQVALRASFEACASKHALLRLCAP